MLIGVAWLLVAGQSFALRVLLVEPPQSDATLFEAFGRLRAELELQSFEVEVLKPSVERINTDSLELEAQTRSAFAAVALQRNLGSTTVELWIVDRVTGKTVLRKLKIDDGKDGPTLLAIRAVDLLRTSLLELDPGERPPPDVVGVEDEPPPIALAEFTRSLPQFQVKLGGSLLIHPSLGASGGAAIEIIYHPVPRMALGLKFVGPVFGGEYQASNGAASVRQEFAVVRFAWNFGSSQSGSRWEWGPVAGVGVSHLTATGVVESPLVARQSDLWGFALLGGINLEYYFTDAVSLSTEASILGLVPQPVIAVTDQESAPLAIQGVGTANLGISF